MRNFTIILMFIFTGSCVSHNGLITSSTDYPKDDKFEYIDIAVGYCKVSYFFGMGGFGKDAFINEAKRNLYLSYPLKPNQTMENLTLDVKKTTIWPYQKVEAIVIGDVIERDSSFEVHYSKAYKELLYKNKSTNLNYLSLNENISFLSKKNIEYPGKIVKLNKKRATLFYVDDNGVLQIDNVGYDKIFKINDLDEIQSKIGFVVGDSINFSMLNSSNKEISINGIILGLNRNSALIKTSGSKMIVKYDEMKKN